MTTHKQPYNLKYISSITLIFFSLDLSLSKTCENPENFSGGYLSLPGRFEAIFGNFIMKILSNLNCSGGGGPPDFHEKYIIINKYNKV